METPDSVALDVRSGEALRDLSEIAGRPNSVATRCGVACGAGRLTVVVDAEDPDPAGLIATVSAPGGDRFLYEEDCVQIATAEPGSDGVSGFLLVNARGTRNEAGAAGDWAANAEALAPGWRLTVEIPVRPDAPCLGLSVHRFFRGVDHEVHGLTPTLPHPLDPAAFAVAVIGGDSEAADIAADYARQLRAAQADRLVGTLAAARTRMAAAHAARGTRPSLATAKALARRRAEEPLCPDDGFLCWNEGYFQAALIDLWELTGETGWLELAAARMDEIWSFRGTEQGTPDKLWGRPLPTWYNARETGTACTLTSGVIISPVARLIRAVAEHTELAPLRDRTEGWLTLCRQVLDLHDDEWTEFADGSGMHLEPFVKGPPRVYPSGGSRVNPLNREFAFGIPMLNIGRVTGCRAYLDKVTKMAQYFRNTSEVSEHGFVWEYLVGAYPAEGEDIDHAHVQVRFAELCVREGIVFGADDLRRMAATLSARIFRHGDVPCGTLRGYRPGLHAGLGTWAGLCRFVPDILPRIEAVVETLLREGHRLFGGTEGYGIRILTCMEKARRAIADGDPSRRSPG